MSTCRVSDTAQIDLGPHQPTTPLLGSGSNSGSGCRRSKRVLLGMPCKVESTPKPTRGHRLLGRPGGRQGSITLPLRVGDCFRLGLPDVAYQAIC